MNADELKDTISFFDDKDLEINEIGSKAFRLAEVMNCGISVPKWFSVKRSAFAQLIDQIDADLRGLWENLDASSKSEINDLSSKITAKIFRLGAPCLDRKAIEKCFDGFFGPNDLVAVRSSATDEDSKKNSFAGQLDSFLCIARNDLFENILKVFSSAYSPRILAYRKANGLASPQGTSVLVQKMVSSVASGVMFTVDPVLRDFSKSIIVSGFGLGEGIVQGIVETDTFNFDRDSKFVSGTVVKKEKQVALLGSGTALVKVAAEKAQLSTLNDEQVKTLFEIGLKLEHSFLQPQDVEWAVDGSGQIFITQSRPITTVDSGSARYFDCSNISEGYPGVSTPLTYSFTKQYYQDIFTQTLLDFGISNTFIRAERNCLENLISALDGKIY